MTSQFQGSKVLKTA